MNHVILLGNIGRDPEIRSTTTGTKAATLSLATTERWADKQTGERKEKTEWHRVVAFGPVCDVIEKHVHKGDKLMITGKIQTRKFVDQSGTERYMTEVVLDQLEFAGSAGEAAQASTGSATPRRQAPPAARRGQAAGGDIDEDQIPF